MAATMKQLYDIIGREAFMLFSNDSLIENIGMAKDNGWTDDVMLFEKELGIREAAQAGEGDK